MPGSSIVRYGYESIKQIKSSLFSPDDSIDICKLEYCLVEEPATINRIVENYMDNCRQILPYAESVCKV